MPSTLLGIFANFSCGGKKKSCNQNSSLFLSAPPTLSLHSKKHTELAMKNLYLKERYNHTIVLKNSKIASNFPYSLGSGIT